MTANLKIFIGIACLFDEEKGLALVGEFAGYAHNANTIDFQFHYRVLHFYAKALCHDWPAALQVAEEAIRFFESKPFVINAYLIGFNYQKASCLLMLARYEEAKAVLDKSLPWQRPIPAITSKTANWPR
jgi:hypothetical protein